MDCFYSNFFEIAILIIQAVHLTTFVQPFKYFVQMYAKLFKSEKVGNQDQATLSKILVLQLDQFL